MRSSSARLSSGRVIETISTFSNWCWRSMPAVSLPAEPASERKHWVWAVMRIGSWRLVEDLAGDEVGQRHLRGRDQPPAVGGAVAVLGELRQLAGAEHRLVADEHRGPDLGQAVRLDVGVEHELGERPVQADHRAFHHHEAGAGEPAGGLEVEAGPGRGNLVVLQWLVREVPRAAPAADLDVGGLVGAVGDVRERQVRDASGAGRAARRRPAAASASRRAISSFLSATSARRRSNSASSPRALAAPTALEAALRSASAVSAATMRARRVSSRARISRARRRQAAAGEGGVEGLGVVADGADVVHFGLESVRGGLWRTSGGKERDFGVWKRYGTGMEPVWNR